MSSENAVSRFSDLALPAPLQQALNDVGYETPSAIQAQTIPSLLEGVDLLGQAQTGTGKTAAFALPVLAKIDLKRKKPQALVLAPTRELAIQVAEAFQKYARHMPGFQVLPVYGGADMRGQLRQLERGVHVVVGTPGRVMDHIRRKSMDLSELKTLVLDEADEMLRMGFIDDVEWILEQTPPQRQIALFSATMPTVIRRIAQKHLRDPREVTIKVKTVTNASIRQRVWMMAGVHKLDALTRILEVEDFDGIIVFVRTRLATVELADKLSARGYSTAALNGDIPQKQRETTVENLKRGKIDILVATDVAARGLDVERISHVINYDIPYDVEAYVHRIGRTGRAGRSGEAILFAANRERRLLGAIEKATGKIEKMTLPTAEEVTDKRLDRFKKRISETLDSRDLSLFRRLVEDYQSEHGVPVIDIAAALGALAQGKQSLQVTGSGAATSSQPNRQRPERKAREERKPRDSAKTPSKAASKTAADKPAADKPTREQRETKEPRKPRAEEVKSAPTAEAAAQPAKATIARAASSTAAIDMERFRIEVGHQHGVKPGNIVGAIANEAELDAEYIGRIEIFDDHSLIDLPEGMPKELFKHLKTVWVSGQKLQISRADGGLDRGAGKPKKGGKAKPKSGPKPGSKSGSKNAR